MLAHTLSALSVQLEALDAVVTATPDSSGEIRTHLDTTKRLVRSGLEEARGAVHALRESQPPLEEQLAVLASDRRAALQITGSPRPLGPEVSLALYRVAQEAVTNAIKHAPGAAVELNLAFGHDLVSLSIINNRPRANDSPLADTGGGHGIQGIEERILLVGGRVEAGPTDAGWRMVAEVPA